MEITASASDVISSVSIAPVYSLVIPAHNEEKRIGLALTGYLDAFSDGEVILVCNGCTDGTEAVARKLAGERTNLRVIVIDHAIGKGGAVRAGFLAARASVMGYVDADGATPPGEIRRLFRLVQGDVDAVIGSRWTSGALVTISQPFERRLASRTLNLIVRLLFGLPYHDTQCGAKVFRGEALAEITHALEVANFAFDIDILHALRMRGRKVLEVPTVWQDVEDSRVNLGRASTQMFLALVRLRLRYSLFRYAIPLFDRFWPTTPLRVRNGLAVLFLNRHDPLHPHAGEHEHYLHEVGKRLIARGHRVEWLCAGFAGSSRKQVIDGIRVHRVGNSISVFFLAPLMYLRYFRDRFDAIVDAESVVPFFSPLFSLKPKVCLVADRGSRDLARSRSSPFGGIARAIRAAVTPFVYGRSRFVAMSNDAKEALHGRGIPADQVDLADGISAEPHSSNDRWDRATDAMLESMQHAVLEEYGRLVCSSDGNGTTSNVGAAVDVFPKTPRIRFRSTRGVA